MLTRFRPPILALLCVAWLAAGIAGPHLHLCLDGSEPPMVLHLSDAGDDLTPATEDAHHDQTLDAVSPAVGKLQNPGLDQLVLLIGVLLFFLSLPRFRWAAADTQRPAPSASARLRPPLRGPPAAA
jgi:hypothetical protein